MHTRRRHLFAKGSYPGACLALALLAVWRPPGHGGAADNAWYARPESPRITRTINRDWTFNYFPSGEQDPRRSDPGYDDSLWPAVALPHTWSTYETTGEKHPFIRSASEQDDPYWWHGWGWYRKHFQIDQRHQDKKIFIEFDGVQKYAQVFLNGQLVGDHKGGYTSFSLDLTPFVKFGADNLLAVRVSNRRDDPFGGIPPMTAGNFNVYGGIYRDVRLVLKDSLHVPYQGSADRDGGTFVTTPEVSASAAVVHVATYVLNYDENPKDCTVTTVITDAEDRVLQRMEIQRRLAPGAFERFYQQSGSLKNPRLWSPEDPYLYRVYTEIRSAGRLTDTYLSPLGFRWFNWNRDEKRLYLNNSPVHIHGTNRHQEYPWLGDAMPKWLHIREMQDIRFNMGHNFMRTAHYPQDPLIYDLTDQYGIIVVEEVPNIKDIDFSEEVQEQNVREMIRRDRNHPSILFWSMGNETNDAADSAWAWSEDTTRIIHLRNSEGGGAHVTHTEADLDMENLLRVTIRGWYDKDEKDLEPANSPEIPKSGQQAGTEEWQHKMARLKDASIRGRIDENIVAWLYADHGADREYKNSPLKHINAKGWLDLYRTPKYMYYLWQANYSAKPMIFIHPHFWRSQYEGQTRDLVVDSNCEYVELAVNGVSLGRRVPAAGNFHTVTFEDVQVTRGIVSAVGKKGDTFVTTSLMLAGPAYRLSLTSSHGRLVADRAGLSVVTADVVDEQGVHVYGARNTLKWSVSGPGILAGPEVYETDFDRHEEMEGVGYIDAPVSNIIRSTGTAGTIQVTVSSPGLKPAAVEILAAAPDKEERGGISEPLLSDLNRQPVARRAGVATPAP